MAIGDKIEKALKRLTAESQIKVVDETLEAAIAAVPVAGGSMVSLLSGAARRIVVARAVEVFRAMKERLEAVEESKIDKGFFESEEFQTLLRLSLEQLQTTHDTTKLQAIADGLANGGLLEFSAESRKELFFRILRDLAPNDFQMLKRLVPKAEERRAPTDFWPAIHEPHDETLAVLKRLEAHALVSVSLKSEMKVSGPRFGGGWTPSEAEWAIKKALERSPSRHFKISKLGLEFLSFFGQVQQDTKKEATTRT